MRKATFLALSVLALLAAPAVAQNEPPSWHLGARLGAFDMINSSESYDAVYGSAMPQAGIAVELELRHRLRFALTYDYGQVDGEQVLPTRPPRGTGIDETLTYQPLALTASWVLNPAARWRFALGLGATLLTWKDEGGTRSASGSDPGAQLVAGLDRDLGRWRLGGELRYSTIPDAIGEAGVSKVFGEDDLGGIALHLTAMWRLR